MRNQRKAFLLSVAVGAGLCATARAFDTPKQSRAMEKQVRSVLKGGGSDALPRVFGRPVQAQEEGESRSIRCTAKKLYDTSGGSTKVDIVLTAKVLSDALLGDVSMSNWGKKFLSLSRAPADANYRPRKPSRKSMNRFGLGFANGQKFESVTVYLPKNLAMAPAPQGEMETTPPDGGNVGIGTLACESK